MKRPNEYSRVLLSNARDDAVIVRMGATETKVVDWVVGFHAQQAVEKALKAVLSSSDIEYPHTHSLRKLLQLIGAAKLALPPDHDRIVQLSRFAGDIRYGARGNLTPA